MPYIGVQPSTSFQTLAKQDFTTSATTSYTLSQSVSSANDIALFINNVRQEPTYAYSASGTALTLTAATTSSDDMYCVYLGRAVGTINPASGSVGLSELSATGTKDSTTFLRGDNTFASSGKILQVKQTWSDTVVSATPTSYEDISGMSVNITPSSTSSKVFISYDVSMGVSTTTTNGFIKLLRGSTDIGLSTTGTTSNHQIMFRPETTNAALVGGFRYLDSPSTSSQITYKLQWFTNGSGTLYLNRRGQNTNFGMASHITVMEVGA